MTTPAAYALAPLDLSTWAQQAVGGSMLLALPVALLAGLVSFFSPCVVPLLPGYLSYASGLGAAEVSEGTRRKGRMLAGTSLFVLGIAAVFVVTGAVIGSAGVLVLTHAETITRVLGVVFALGWTPCIGPTLAAVYSLALNEGTAFQGGLLAFVFALGLGLPFVAAGLLYARMSRAVGFLRRHQTAVMRTGGILMVVVGLLLVTGLWATMTADLRQSFATSTPAI